VSIHCSAALFLGRFYFINGITTGCCMLPRDTAQFLSPMLTNCGCSHSQLIFRQISRSVGFILSKSEVEDTETLWSSTNAIQLCQSCFSSFGQYYQTEPWCDSAPTHTHTHTHTPQQHPQY